MKEALAFNKMLIAVIKAIRETKGINQIVLAEALFMTQSNYSKIESGRTCISTTQLALLCEVLETTPRKIISLAEAMSKRTCISGPLESQIIALYQSCIYSLLDDYKHDNLLMILERLAYINSK